MSKSLSKNAITIEGMFKVKDWVPPAADILFYHTVLRNGHSFFWEKPKISTVPFGLEKGKKYTLPNLTAYCDSLYEISDTWMKKLKNCSPVRRR